MVVDKKPALDVVQGKVAAIVPVALAELVELALPDMLADQAQHWRESVTRLGNPVVGNEVRSGLDQDADRTVKVVGRVGGSGGGGGGLGRDVH